MENLKRAIESLQKRVEVLEGKLSSTSNKKQTVKQNQRDTSKYMFQGSVYGKNRLVLAVVSEYVKQNPKTTYQQLLSVFDKSLQGSLGVFAGANSVSSMADVAKRFFVKHPIKLSDETIVVCTQWGQFNITKFLLRTQQLGFDVIKV